MITVTELVDRIRQVDMHGLLDVKPSDNGDFLLVEFWRLGGAFRDDRSKKLTMVIDPAKEGLEGELFFYAPTLEKCKPKELALTMYMDADARFFHGKHAWSASEEDVFFAYAMPLPDDTAEFPSPALFERLLKDMYRGLLFREVKSFQLRIEDDDMLSEEEKTAKHEQVEAMIKRLTGPRVPTDGV